MTAQVATHFGLRIFTVTSDISCFGIFVLPVGDDVIAAQSPTSCDNRAPTPQRSAPPPTPTALDRFEGGGVHL